MTLYGFEWTGVHAQRIVLGMTLSARNRLRGKITEIELGGVVAHVVLQVGSDTIESVITKRSVEEMKLKVGDTVTAVIKSTEVMLEK
jgi:molybdopterin-binding protein